MNCVFWVQASIEVGFGHLYECLAVAEEMQGEEIFFILFESSSVAEELIRQRGYEVNRVDSDSLHSCKKILNTCVVVNTRKNELSLQMFLKERCQTLVIIDELGNKKVDCDSLINFSVCKEWLSSYKFVRRPKQFFGPQYYPLRREFSREKKRVKFERNPKILVSLGGADRTRTTLFLAELLSEFDNFEFTYVIGPGFDFGKDEVFERTNGKTNHKVVQYPKNLARLMAQHSLMFSFGGNMLFEAAYLGIPAVIVWEDEHERVQGEAFEKKGAARVLGCAGELKKTLIRKGFIELMNNDEALRKMSVSGQSLVDGKGCSRIADIIKRCG